MVGGVPPQGIRFTLEQTERARAHESVRVQLLQIEHQRAAFMLLTIQIITVLLVAMAMGLALAHALELPGKLRLDKETYVAVQSIYYPGFTIGGLLGEGIGLLITLTLLLVTPWNRIEFWLTLIGFMALLAMHAVFWVITQPTNRFWLKDQQLKGMSAGFFSVDPLKREGSPADANDNWKILRDRWEYSHVIRAGLSMIALVALVVAVAV